MGDVCRFSKEIIIFLEKELGNVLTKDELRNQAILLKGGDSSSSSDKEAKELKDMNTDEALNYLDGIDPNWRKMLEEGDKPRDYARRLVKEARKKK